MNGVLPQAVPREGTFRPAGCKRKQRRSAPGRVGRRARCRNQGVCWRPCTRALCAARPANNRANCRRIHGTRRVRREGGRGGPLRCPIARRSSASIAAAFRPPALTLQPSALALCCRLERACLERFPHSPHRLPRGGGRWQQRAVRPRLHSTPRTSRRRWSRHGTTGHASRRSQPMAAHSRAPFSPPQPWVEATCPCARTPSQRARRPRRGIRAHAVRKAIHGPIAAPRCSVRAWRGTCRHACPLPRRTSLLLQIPARGHRRFAFQITG